MQKKDHYHDSYVDLNDEELKIMQEVKGDDKKTEKSGIEKKIKLLINIPDRFKEFDETINNSVNFYRDILQRQFSEKYIAYKKNPDNNISKRDFFSVIQQMKRSDALVSETRANIQEETGKINDLVDSINQILDIEKKDNELLNKEKKMTQKNIYGSEAMIGDFVDEYKRLRLENILFVTATIYLFLYFCYFMYKRWKPPSA